MADVKPFHGLRYNPSLAGDLTDLISPPYDVISPSQLAELHHRSPYNAVRLELSETRPTDTYTDNRYTRTAATFQDWLKQGILVPDDTPALYAVEETFELKGVTNKRRGLMACVRLEEFGKGSTFPHEHTTEGPKKDRLELIKACSANFSPVMGLFPDANASVQSLLSSIMAGAPAASTHPIEGVLAYRLWEVKDAALISKICAALKPKPIFIADGHHRYETALNYRNLLKAQGKIDSETAAANFVMMTLIPLEDPGLLVWPYHRLINGLSDGERKALRARFEKLFDNEAVELSGASPESAADAIAARLAQTPKDQIAFGTYVEAHQSRAAVLLLKMEHSPSSSAPLFERCDSRFLSQAALRPVLGEARENECVSFIHDATEAVAAVQKGRQQMALILRPLPMDLFQEVVSHGDRLPPKSTYFYPKLPTGLIFNRLVGER